jgi:hypothetical protein
MADQRGEVRDADEIYALDREAVGIFHQNAIVREHAGESFVRRREGQRPFESRAIAIDREVGEVDVTAAPATEDGAAVELGGSPERGVIASDRKLMRTVRKLELGGNLSHARG